jgi:pyrroloquinoline-quinone synthase
MAVLQKKDWNFLKLINLLTFHHRAECEKLLDGLSKDEQKKAETAALSTAKYLWNFLSGMSAKHNLQVAA